MNQNTAGYSLVYWIEKTIGVEILIYVLVFDSARISSCCKISQIPCLWDLVFLTYGVTVFFPSLNDDANSEMMLKNTDFQDPYQMTQLCNSTLMHGTISLPKGPLNSYGIILGPV